jgi:hypothetical protein
MRLMGAESSKYAHYRLVKADDALLSSTSNAVRHSIVFKYYSMLNCDFYTATYSKQIIQVPSQDRKLFR